MIVGDSRMPVVEITQLRLKGLSAGDPLLLESLSQVRYKLQTNSRFFSCIGDPSLIYIFGFWTSLDAHMQFLASPARDEILGPQEDILDFEWTIHLNLDNVSPSLFEAPFIAVQRLKTNASHVNVSRRVIGEHVRTLQTVAAFEVIYGWRCDMPVGGHEAVILTSWVSESLPGVGVGTQIALDSHDAGLHRQTLFHCARNLEPMQPQA